MQKFIHITLLSTVLLMSGCATHNPAQNAAIRIDAKTAELINRSEVVAVVSSVDHAVELEQKAARWGYDLKRKESLDGLDLFLLTFNCPPGIDPHVASQELERLQPQSIVEANHKYTLQSSFSEPTKFSPRNYANRLIQWPEDGCESYLKVGIIDGRVDKTAASLKTANIRSKSFLKPGDIDGAIDHGTAVAELLVGGGRLKNTELYAASVVGIDADGSSYSGVEPMLKALDWMIRSNVNVVNISLAGPYNRTLDRGISQARGKGVIIVAAVGNDGETSAPKFPAALDSVIAATAVDSQKNIYKKAVRGDHVDISAPGVEVFVGDDSHGRYVSGTSIAAPFVVAKIASDERFKTVNDINDIRGLLAQNSQDLGEKGRDAVFGNGLLRANDRCKM